MKDTKSDPFGGGKERKDQFRVWRERKTSYWGGGNKELARGASKKE